MFVLMDILLGFILNDLLIYHKFCLKYARNNFDSMLNQIIVGVFTLQRWKTSEECLKNN